MTAADLRDFEDEVAAHFEAGRIHAPVHLSGGNEKQLIEIFKGIDREDWIFSTWRSHFHALLHGVPREQVMAAILAGRSMGLMFPEYRFFCSSILGGIAPIAVGVAAALKWQHLPASVYCFVGDMAARSGIFHETTEYAKGHGLPVSFYVEDNGLSCDTPTEETWGTNAGVITFRYRYVRRWPSVNTGKFVKF